MDKSDTGDRYLDRTVNREQAVKLKKQAKFDLIKKENIALLQENKKLKKKLEKLLSIINS